MSVTDYLQRLVNQITYTVTLAIQIVATLITSGWYIVVRDAAVTTTDIHTLLEDPTCGQEAQCTKLDAILSDLATILSDLAAPTWTGGGGTYVLLPATPPTGYGGASASDAAAAVWNTPNYSGYAMGDSMRSLQYLFDGVNSNLAFPSPTGGPFVISANIGAFNAEPWLYTPDYGLDSILTTDTDVGAWLNRVAGRGETWTLDSDSLYWRTFGLGNPANNTTWYCTLSEVQFKRIQALMAGSTINLAPVWPGLANVTLGAPHTMVTPGETVMTPCDGVIVTISGVPPWAGKFVFGADTAWRNVGALTFLSDNDNTEYAQTLGFESAVFLPKSMTTAAGYSYRVAGGVSGTLTPFVIN